VVASKRTNAWGAYGSERRPWGSINTLCSHLKTYFKADDQNMPRNNVLFLEKATAEHSSGVHKLWERINNIAVI